MAGGPVAPRGIAFEDTNAYPGVYLGATNARQFQVDGLVVASLGTGTAVVRIEFDMPEGSLPSGTCTLRLYLYANATSGAAYVQVSWASVATADTPDTISLNTEGAAAAMHTWASGDDDEQIEYTLTLDADTPVAGETIQAQLTFGNTASHNLAAVMAFKADIVFV